MKDDIFDILGSALPGAKKTGNTNNNTNYTLEEIRKAQEYKKKNGGTLLDSLKQVTGHDLPSQMDFDSFYKNLEKDFGMTTEEADRIINENEYLKDCGMDTSSKAYVEPKKKKNNDAPENSVKSLDRFNGIHETLSQKVFGQEEFLRKLVIAFKRPLVMPTDEGRAKNAIFVNGPESSGKHLALNELAGELKSKGILDNGKIHTIDLALYTDAGDEQLFLQDLYSALSGGADIVMFENYEKCQASLLTYIGSLITTGSCRLSSRYVMQNGQLINAANSLASNAIGSLSAAGRYIVLISSGKQEKLADAFGAPVVNALGDVCTSRRLDDQDLKKIAIRECGELHTVAKDRLAMELEYDEALIELSVVGSERPEGPNVIISFYDKLLKSLAELRLEETAIPSPASIKLTVNADGIVEAVYDGKILELKGMSAGGYTGAIDAVKAEMEKIVGLSAVKEYVLGLEEFYKVQKRRRDQGLKIGEVSKHMIFTGNPGTGKTTIARILSRYLKALGILSGGQLVEVTRADLVGRYVGHTAPLTNKVIASAIGGVLFIDEAYSLYRGKEDSFGLEAIDTLVKGIEDNRDNLIVVLAGYSKEMTDFLESNSGLKSRFPNQIDFPDYTGEELLKITKIQAESRGYKITEDAEPMLLEYYNQKQATDAKTSGNGRMARNKLEEAIINQSRRLAVETDGDLSTLVLGDFDL